MEYDPTDKSVGVDDLPNELLTFIFEHLRIKDLIRCSLVCRRLRLICKQVKIPELIITNKIENIRDLWFYTNKQFNHQDAIAATTFSSLRSTFRFDKLRRLHFKGSQTEYDQLNVNALTQLEQLKIDLNHMPQFDIKFYIDLPNLKIVEITAEAFEHTFHIRAPKLVMLKCMNFDTIRLTYPDTVQHVEESIHSTSTIDVLKNVQFYQIPIDDIAATVRSITKSVFPKLRTLSTSLFNFCHREQVDSLRHLVEQKLQLQRPELRIYFESVELDTTAKVNEFYNRCNSLAFPINNYDSLCENNVCGFGRNGINYNELMYLVDGQIPVDFSKKYFNTRCVRVTEKVENQVHLFRFLKSFDYLSELRVKSESLDQSFFDSLSELDQLTKVVVENCSKSISNYGFLFKLKLLKWFETDSEPLNFFHIILALFSHLKYFRSITFVAMNRVSITRHKSNYYELRSDCGDQHLKLHLNLDGLVRIFGAPNGIINLDSSKYVNGNSVPSIKCS